MLFFLLRAQQPATVVESGVGANSYGRGQVWTWTGGAVRGGRPRATMVGDGDRDVDRDGDGDGTRIEMGSGDEEDRFRQTEKASLLDTILFLSSSPVSRSLFLSYLTFPACFC